MRIHGRHHQATARMAVAVVLAAILVPVALELAACGDSSTTTPTSPSVTPSGRAKWWTRSDDGLSATDAAAEPLGQHKLSAPERRALAAAQDALTSNWGGGDRGDRLDHPESPRVVAYVVGIVDFGFFMAVSVDPDTGDAWAESGWGSGVPPSLPNPGDKIPPAGDAERWAEQVALAAARDWMYYVPGLHFGATFGSSGVSQYAVTWPDAARAPLYWVTSDGEVVGSEG